MIIDIIAIKRAIISILVICTVPPTNGKRLGLFIETHTDPELGNLSVDPGTDCTADGTSPDGMSNAYHY